MDHRAPAVRAPGPVLRALWTLLGLAAVVSLPLQWRTGRAIWLVEPRVIVFGLLGAIGYLGAAALAAQARSGGRVRIVLNALVATAGMFALLGAIPLVAPEFPMSRAILLAAGALTAALLVLPEAVPAVRGTLGVTLLAAAVGVGQVITGGTTPIASFTVDSHYYLLRADIHRDALLESPTIEGGGLSVVGSDAIWMSGDGMFARVALGEDGVDVVQLDLPSPVNRAAFVEGVGPSVNAEHFRAVDLIAERVADSVRILASHHYWHPDRACFTFRVSETRGSTSFQGWQPWRTVFETDPCLGVDTNTRGPAFAGGGGRLSRDGADLVLTVGDHGHDGFNMPEDLTQADGNHYGKVLRIGPDGRADVVSRGHRNPQGLAVDQQGRIWATEHGPRGGDELNLVRDSANYGWPRRTSGTEYGLRAWPLLEAPSAEYVEPALAWVPSIGVSNILAIPDGTLPAWAGDLLVGSLKERTIFRVRLDGDRVVYAEPIRIGHEVRDLVLLPDGRVLVWTDEGPLIEISIDTNVPEGAELASACASCHTLDLGQPSGIGPNLFQVVGRPVAAVGSFGYSDALRSLGGRWTPARLDAFLENPARFAPGTSMDWPGIADPDQRRSLIEYLRGVGVAATGPPP